MSNNLNTEYRHRINTKIVLYRINIKTVLFFHNDEYKM